jgi:hypothetical protein
MSTFTQIPGLTQTVTVAANSVVLISTDGGASTTSQAASGYSEVDIGILVDGALTPSALITALDPANTTGIVERAQDWALQGTVVLGPGPHTITVAAEGSPGSGSASAQVGGGDGSFLQPNLTVTILNT